MFETLDASGGPRLFRELSVRVTAGPDVGTVCGAAEATHLSVGTALDNDLVLTDRTVSRYHLELVRTPTGVRVVDLGSTNGVVSGSLRIEQATVEPGTTLTLGGTTLVLEEGAERIAEALEVEPIEGLVAQSRPMLDVLARVARLATSEVAVLVQGETGSGKEGVARAIHDGSARAAGPFVVLDCGALPPTLVSSELFGHERGAFTGADRRRQGAFERAHGGTLFLDEIGELPREVQPALLGVLERKRFRRVGGDEELVSDVRVVSATHRDLRPETNDGSFRPDLYFRLAVARIHVPPLRERRDDIEPLVRHFVRELTGSEEASWLTPETLDALRAERWSGNVRELRNVVEAAVALGQAPAPGSEASVGSDVGFEPEPLLPYKEARAAVIDRFEREYLRRLIEQADHNASEAARRARMDRPWLIRLLRRHGLR